MIKCEKILDIKKKPQIFYIGCTKCCSLISFDYNEDVKWGLIHTFIKCPTCGERVDLIFGKYGYDSRKPNFYDSILQAEAYLKKEVENS